MNDAFADRLSEYLDGELSSTERASIDAHLALCGECRRTLGELRRVIARAAAATDSPPARDLWPGVAARIGAPVHRLPVFRRILTSRLSFTLPQLAAAALALMVLSGGLVWMAKSGDPRADFQPLSADTSRQPAGSPVTNEEAIAQLEQALAAERGNLDAETRRTLDREVAAADSSIENARRALAADPGNAALRAELANAQQRKLSVLRAALSQASRRGR